MKNRLYIRMKNRLYIRMKNGLYIRMKNGLYIRMKNRLYIRMKNLLCNFNTKNVNIFLNYACQSLNSILNDTRKLLILQYNMNNGIKRSFLVDSVLQYPQLSNVYPNISLSEFQ